MSCYKFKFVKSFISEIKDRMEFDPRVKQYNTVKKGFSITIYIKANNPEKGKGFYNFVGLNLLFLAFENPPSYLMKIYWSIPGYTYKKEQAPQILLDNKRDILRKLFIDDLGLQKSYDFDYSSSLYITRLSDMTLEDFIELVELLTEELKERWDDCL